MTERCENHDHCIRRAERRADVLCLDKGVRLTSLRRRVLRMIWAGHRPVKAYELLAGLRREHAPAEPPTVYRTLDFLCEHGLVHRIESLKSWVGCPHPDAHETCSLLICTLCGEVTECCDVPILGDALAEAAAHHRFRIRRTVVEIQGECHLCLSQQKTKRIVSIP